MDLEKQKTELLQFKTLRLDAEKSFRELPNRILENQGCRFVHEPSLRLTFYPSFDDWFEWTLFEVGPRDEKSGWVVEVRWNRNEDQSRAFEEVPLRVRTASIRTRFAQIDPCRIPNLLESLSGVTLPALPRKTVIGLDGASYSLEANLGFSSVRWKWWSNEPAEWDDLIQWADRLQDQILKFLDQPSRK